MTAVLGQDALKAYVRRPTYEEVAAIKPATYKLPRYTATELIRDALMQFDAISADAGEKEEKAHAFRNLDMDLRGVSERTGVPHPELRRQADFFSLGGSSSQSGGDDDLPDMRGRGGGALGFLMSDDEDDDMGAPPPPPAGPAPMDADMPPPGDGGGGGAPPAAAPAAAPAPAVPAQIAGEPVMVPTRDRSHILTMDQLMEAAERRAREAEERSSEAMRQSVAERAMLSERLDNIIRGMADFLQHNNGGAPHIAPPAVPGGPSHVIAPQFVTLIANFAEENGMDPMEVEDALQRLPAETRAQMGLPAVMPPPVAPTPPTQQGPSDADLMPPPPVPARRRAAGSPEERAAQRQRRETPRGAVRPRSEGAVSDRPPRKQPPAPASSRVSSAGATRDTMSALAPSTSLRSRSAGSQSLPSLPASSSRGRTTAGAAPSVAPTRAYPGSVRGRSVAPRRGTNAAKPPEDSRSRSRGSTVPTIPPSSRAPSTSFPPTVRNSSASPVMPFAERNPFDTSRSRSRSTAR